MSVYPCQEDDSENYDKIELNEICFMDTLKLIFFDIFRSLLILNIKWLHLNVKSILIPLTFASFGIFPTNLLF